MSKPIALIESIIQELKYDSRIPRDDSVNLDLVSQLLSNYDKPFLTQFMIKDIILDSIFELKLKKLRTGDEELSSEEIAEQARSINEDILSLPAQYKIIFPLPESKKPINVMIPGPRMKIYSLSEDFHRYPKNDEKDKERHIKPSLLTDVIGGLSSAVPLYSKGDVILEFEVMGYISQYAQLQIDSYDPLYFYKIVIYLLYGQNAFEKRTNTRLYGTSIVPMSYYAFTRTNEIVRSFNGRTEDTKYIESIKFEQSIVEANTLEMRIELVKKVLTNVPNSTPEAVRKLQSRLRNSAYWCYEANTAADAHVRIVNICTAFDALIGDAVDSKEQKAELISQLISSNSRQESDNSSTIIEIYKLRNDIVHGSTDINTLSRYRNDSRTSQSILIYKAKKCLDEYYIRRIRSLDRSV